MATTEAATERAAPRRPPTSYAAQVEALSRASVHKYYRAFHDIDWDAPENSIDPTDPRLELRAASPLGQSAWYRALPAVERARLGLEMTCQIVKFGIGFEANLTRGLSEFAGSLPNRSPEYRYALHELIEESQHSLMFQQLIDQSGTDPVPAGRVETEFARLVARSGESFPTLFFFFVLSGELFIDAENRAQLVDERHPLLRRVLQIHVTEEARHVRFAELYLRENVPRLGRLARTSIALVLPFVLEAAQRSMLMPAPSVVSRFAIPRPVLKELYGPGSAHRRKVEQIAAPLFALLGAEGQGKRVFWAR